MKKFEHYTVLEHEQAEKVRKTGEIYGNSGELREACQEAYRLYRAGRISAECYGQIYSDAFDKYMQ